MSFRGLMSDFVEPCTLMEKTRQPDGEGGWITGWNDGMAFEAAITLDTTLEARVAEAGGVRSVYTVTTDRAMPLEYHDVFRRDRDGQTFRVTAEGIDKHTPDRASFQVSQVAAEKWELV